MITAYALIYTSRLIISGCLQRADATTSHVLGAAEGSSTVSTPPGPPQSSADGSLRRSRPAWEQKSEAVEHETAFSHQETHTNPTLRSTSGLSLFY